MHDSPNDPKARTLRILSYVFIAVFVGLGTYYLANYAQGIFINPATGDSVQNGLAIIQSKPVNADVKINGQQLDEATPTRQILPIGNYTAEISADGYRPWSKDFVVAGSDITWLDYPLLIPTQIKTTQDSVFNKKPIITASNNRRLLASSTSVGEIRLFNVSADETTESKIDLSDSVVESLGPKPRLVQLDFAANDRYLLAQYKSGGSDIFVRIDRSQPQETLNLNNHFNLNVDELKFDEDGNFDDFFGKVGTKVYSLNVDDKSAEVVAESVESFLSLRNMLFTTTREPKQKTLKLSYVTDGETKEIDTIQKKNTGSSKLSAQQFKNKVNVALSLNSETRIYRNIKSKTRPDTEIVKIKTKQQEFTSNGRFLAITDGLKAEVFDLEFDRSFSFQLSKRSAKISWLDNFRIATVVSEEAMIIDFDGNNKQLIVKGDKSFQPIATQDNESLITISKDTNKYVLERSRLRTDE